MLPPVSPSMGSPQSSFTGRVSPIKPARTGCPFAVEGDDDVISIGMSRSSSFRGGQTREGGPKEARLRRTALLGEHIDDRIESLSPVRVDNIPEKLPHDVLMKDFSIYGEIGDLKVLTSHDGKNRGVGFVKYISRPDAIAAAQGMTGKIYHGYHVYGEMRGLACQLAQHSSFFSQNTGALGMFPVLVNSVCDD